MTAWLRRNSLPILATLAAAALVIIGFEALDSVTAGGAVTANPETATEAQGGLAFAGLIKVTLLLAVPIGVTLFIRRNKPDDATAE